MQENKTLSRAEWLDKIFGTPVFAVLLAIFCNVLWGLGLPFHQSWATGCSPLRPAIPRPFSALPVCGSCWAAFWCCWAVCCCKAARPVPRGKVAAECCALGLWQTTFQYAFYYIAVAMLTGAFGGILNSTQSFLGVIFAHFIYGNADRMTPCQNAGLRHRLCGRAHRHAGQPRQRKRLGRVLHDGRYHHLYPVRPVEQIRDQKKQTALPSASSTCSWAVWHCSCWALCWAAASMCRAHWRWWSCCIWPSSAGQAMCCGPC